MRVVSPTTENIRLAAQAILNGELVVMPTETVYGLACNALDPAAVQKVFEAKGRPADNPLIVHIAGKEQLGDVADSWPLLADELAAKFWPGPLTLVLPKSVRIPPETTAGLDTVAVRVPAHPVAQSLIEQAGVPIAAPSANLFMGLSATRLSDVSPELLGVSAYALDAGPSDVGLESTVLDLSGEQPRLLRPGGLPREELEKMLGPLGTKDNGERRSPGMYRKHYSPKAKLTLVDRLDESQVGLTISKPLNEQQIQMPQTSAAYGAHLYTSLHQLDQLNLQEIFVERPPVHPSWEAVLDRLMRASSV